MDEKFEAELKSFMYLVREDFEERKKDRDEGITIRAMFDEQQRTSRTVGRLKQTIENTVTPDIIATNMKVDRYRAEQRKHAKILQKLGTGRADLMNGDPDFALEPLEDTGSFRLDEIARARELSTLRAQVEKHEDELQEKKEEAKDEEKRWRWKKIDMFSAVLLACFVASLSGCSAVVVYYVSHMETKSKP